MVYQRTVTIFIACLFVSFTSFAQTMNPSVMYCDPGVTMPSETVESASVAASATTVSSGTDTLELTLDNLYNKEKLFGKTPQDMAWSHDSRYLAYRWNIYDATGYDVWLYDSESGENKQLTDVERFAPFDEDARKIAEAIAKQEGHADDVDDKKPENSKEKLPEYAGVASFVWSETKTEMLVSYKNDLYRLDIETDAIERLTKTKEEERRFLYTKNGDGYIFWQGSSMNRIYFGDSYIEEIYPNIPDGQNVDRLILSPDQKWLAIVASKSKGGNSTPRKVGYISYRDRFAKWQEHNRPLAEDPEPNDREEWIYLQKVNERIYSGTEDAAVEVFHHPGGEHHLRITTPVWPEDSGQIVFRTYNHETEEIEIYTATVDSTEKAKPVHRARNSGYARSPNRVQPEFTPDGKKIIAVFEDSGFKQPWLIDPVYQGKVPIVRGNFDAQPIDYDEKGKILYVLANKEHPVRKDLYRVNLAKGNIKRITQMDGVYSEPVFSDDGKHFAALFTNWQQPAELVVGTVDSGSETILTDSHSKDLAKLNQLAPELFSFQNKDGQTVYGMVFVPPHLSRKHKPPIVIYTYGGPLGSESMVKYGGFGTYNYRFPMYMAKRHGYIAAVIDPRGSSNYGALFENANWEQPGKPQVEDLADGVDYLVKHYGGDANRVGLYGWSFGGFVTQMAMYTKPEVFTVGMAGAGPTEWENYYGSYTSVTISESQENKPDQKQYSLLPLAKNLKGRLMLLHGIEDTNVLFQDTIKVYQELLKAGKGDQVELVLDPTGNHHMGGDMKYTDIFWHFEDFLLRTLGDGYPNFAQNKPVSASSNQDRHAAERGNDDLLNTYWLPKEDDESPWWQVDLKRERHVFGTEVAWYDDKPEIEFKIEGSEDGNEWMMLADWSNSKEKDKAQRQYFDETSVRYVRITITDAKDQTKRGMIDFKVFGR